MPNNRPFELGLVMAGAISAGAYTAGVLDFLLQALDEWQEAKDRGEDCPQHEVKIKAIGGASAGGMCAAILASLLGEDVEPITSLPGRLPASEVAAQNRLYDCWVRKISIERLLESRDLREKGAGVRSFLDSTVLDEIAKGTLQFSPMGQERPYFAKETHLFLTLTNLRGVPYAIDMRGAGVAEGHALSMHADHVHFVLSQAAPAEDELTDALWLDPQRPSHANWQALRTAALATGAFPGALLPRMLQRSSLHYDQRKWPIPQASGETCTQLLEIPPRWPEDSVGGTDAEDAGFGYDYLCVDGGVMDNEPLELVRRTMASLSGEAPRNPREARKVQRSVLMIDPFPGGTPMSKAEAEALKSYDVLQTLKRLITSLKMQARFKMDELALAQEGSIYSRFMIAPVRYTKRDGQEVQAAHPIASGVMGGFGGFLSERFRQHDFQLGRRNCQQFLRKHFTLPLEEAKENPIFGGDPDALERHKVTFQVEENGTWKEKDFYPIIPLVGSAREEVFPLQWNTLRMSRRDLEQLRRQVTHRTQAVTSRLIDTHLEGSIERTLAKLVLRIKRGSMVDSIMDKIENDLEGYGLLS